MVMRALYSCVCKETISAIFERSFCRKNFCVSQNEACKSKVALAASTNVKKLLKKMTS